MWGRIAPEELAAGSASDTVKAMVISEKSMQTGDILLVDDRIANDWTLMYEICHQVQPTQIVVTTNGYSEHGETFFGVPITHLRQETIQFRFLR